MDFPSYLGNSWELIQGDALAVLGTLADAAVDAVVCDPPYGLGSEPTVEQIVAYLQGEQVNLAGRDFMDKDWQIPSVATWQEVYRVIKPGGHVLCFGGTRTFDLISLGLRAAGFENRDTISAEGVLRWTHAKGFPKGGVRDDGFGATIKPAWEPVLVFRKPFKGTLDANLAAHGVGAFNIDACRLATADKLTRKLGGTTMSPSGWHSTNRSEIAGKDGGRYPTNVVLNHLEGCVLVGHKKVKGDARSGGEGTRPGGFANVGADKGSSKPCGRLYGDADGLETVEEWSCVDGCPVKALDEQSEAASRYFPQFAYVTKASRKEREVGLDALPASASKEIYGDGLNSATKVRTQEQAENGVDRGKVRNDHPTIKPIALMRWLVRLVGGQPGSIILDPYAGTGTTLIAAGLEGFRSVGIDCDPHYIEIARHRLVHWLKDVS